jgi:hypothetical protein
MARYCIERQEKAIALRQKSRRYGYSPAGAGNFRQLLDPDRQGWSAANEPAMQLATKLFTPVSGAFAVAVVTARRTKLL